jgi:sterol desaturase/sphingolipid hydroxylase (fatty acid hydroxylase superfamily)
VAKRSGPSVGILGAAQAAYLAFAAVYIARNGFPAPGAGKTLPYLAYLALNALTFPLATLPLPIVFTLAVSRGRVTARTLGMLREVWLNTLAVVPAVAFVFQGLVEGRIGRLVLRGGAPLWLLLLEGAAFLLLADLWFYVSHRALHSRLLYRFHAAHHAHRAPTEAAAFLALAPSEALFSGVLTIALPMLVIPVHAPVAIACAVVILFCGFYIHDGALATAPRLPFVNGPAHHQIHHGRGRSNANFSLLFTHLDRLLGTYVAPAEAPGGGDVGGAAVE